MDAATTISIYRWSAGVFGFRVTIRLSLDPINQFRCCTARLLAPQLCLNISTSPMPDSRFRLPQPRGALELLDIIASDAVCSWLPLYHQNLLGAYRSFRSGFVWCLFVAVVAVRAERLSAGPRVLEGCRSWKWCAKVS